MTARTDRLDAQLQEEIGQILAREVADPRIGFVTVTSVQTAPDLSHARVWVSVLGPAEQRPATLRALRSAMRFVRHRLGERLALRRIPVLHVRIDDAAERGTRMLQLIEGLEAEGEGGPAGAASSQPLPVPGDQERHSDRS